MTKFAFTFDTETDCKEADVFGVALDRFVEKWSKEIGGDRLAIADDLEWRANWERHWYSDERMDELSVQIDARFPPSSVE